MTLRGRSNRATRRAKVRELATLAVWTFVVYELTRARRPVLIITHEGRVVQP